jgi:hypothetical protein
VHKRGGVLLRVGDQRILNFLFQSFLPQLLVSILTSGSPDPIQKVSPVLLILRVLRVLAHRIILPIPWHVLMALPFLPRLCLICLLLLHLGLSDLLLSFLCHPHLSESPGIQTFASLDLELFPGNLCPPFDVLCDGPFDLEILSVLQIRILRKHRNYCFDCLVVVDIRQVPSVVVMLLYFV